MPIKGVHVTLSDHDIILFRELGMLDIEPFNLGDVQPASYDLTLGSMARDSDDEQWPFCHLTLRQGDFYLLHTAEVVTLGNRVGGWCVGKSSRARKGLIVESAGWVDPGFTGQLVLEVSNLSPIPITLTPGMKIAQIVFTELRSPSLKPYGPARGSHYHGQMGATPDLSGDSRQSEDRQDAVADQVVGLSAVDASQSVVADLAVNQPCTH